MTSLRVNVLETVFVPLITELLSLAKGPLNSAPAIDREFYFSQQICEGEIFLPLPRYGSIIPEKICEASVHRLRTSILGTPGALESFCVTRRRRKLAQTRNKHQTNNHRWLCRSRWRDGQAMII